MSFYEDHLKSEFKSSLSFRPLLKTFCGAADRPSLHRRFRRSLATGAAPQCKISLEVIHQRNPKGIRRNLHKATTAHAYLLQLIFDPRLRKLRYGRPKLEFRLALFSGHLATKIFHTGSPRWLELHLHDRPVIRSGKPPARPGDSRTLRIPGVSSAAPSALASGFSSTPASRPGLPKCRAFGAGPLRRRGMEI